MFNEMVVKKSTKKMRSSKIWSLRKQIGTVVVTGLVAVGSYAAYEVVQTGITLSAFGLSSIAHNDGSDKTTREVKYKELPMVKVYSKKSVKETLCSDWMDKLTKYSDSFDDDKFLEEFAPVEKEMLKLAELVGNKRYNLDWNTGAENLNVNCVDEYVDWNARSVYFRPTRETSNLFYHLSRYCTLKGKSELAAKVMLANVSLVRQYLSYKNTNNGMCLIDSMICLSVVNNINKTVEKTDGIDSYSGKLFPLIKDRFEEIDSMSSLVRQSVLRERSCLPSIMNLFNTRSRHKFNFYVREFSIDEKWMEETLNTYYPSEATFSKPLCEAQARLDEYSEKVEELVQSTSSPMTYFKTALNPAQGYSMYLMAIITPNWKIAYKKECNIRKELRITYLKFAVEYYKDIHGHYPHKLTDLTPYVKDEMLVSPVTGESFNYEVSSGDYTKVTLN